MNTTESAAQLRGALKRRGWSSRQVSVRAKYFALGSSIDVEIKDPGVRLKTVEAIASEHEHIDRCEITGEILGGGNTYLHVRYSSDALNIIGRRYADAVQRAVNAIPEGDTSPLERVEGTDFLVGAKGGRITLWRRDSGYVRDAYTVDDAAETIGINMTSEVQS